MTKIYLQTHKVELYGLSSTEGTEGIGGIFTSKSWIEREENWGLVFLITTGTYNHTAKQDLNNPYPR